MDYIRFFGPPISMLVASVGMLVCFITSIIHIWRKKVVRLKRVGLILLLLVPYLAAIYYLPIFAPSGFGYIADLFVFLFFLGFNPVVPLYFWSSGERRLAKIATAIFVIWIIGTYIANHTVYWGPQ